MTNGLIYFIANESNHIKIGFTNDLKRRVGELQTGSTERLRVLYTIPSVEIIFETHMHKVCQTYHISGEWFQEEVLPFLLEKSSPWFRENMIRHRTVSKKVPLTIYEK